LHISYKGQFDIGISVSFAASFILHPTLNIYTLNHFRSPHVESFGQLLAIGKNLAILNRLF